ncbi:MAG TPA: GAF domain-containing protein [bacterium]|nr:GAF domain-containing protein [bacterium]HOC88741.1 GAF domain-containing protein [bacterium]HOH08207.1 GAF domain-containing protein [bacterium]HOY44254.1 GAF domain-containing protein [bacterium]HPG83373.1 GAF domain-containing protein [bacterium]
MTDPETLHMQQREHERLKMLLKVAGSISSEMQLDKLLRLIMDEVKQVLQCDRCTVFVLDREHNELWSRVAHGESEIRFPAHLGIAGAVVQSGQVINIPDAYADSRFNPNIDRQTGYHTRNLLSAPMRNKPGEIIGVFQILNKLEGPFTREDEEILNAISVLAATQIENAQLYEEQKKTFDSLVETLASTIDARDPLTAGHSQRISLYADEIGRVLRLQTQEREVLRISALLHDYGKIAVREAVLTKNDKLTDEEFSHIRNHAAYTRSILEKINFSRELRQVPLIAASHHERVDGTGYPAGLMDDEIPLLSKILAVADVFDALTSKRHYRTRMPFTEVIQLLLDNIGSQFDPLPVNAFRAVKLDRLVRILEHEHPDRLEAEELHFLSGFDSVDYITAAQAEAPEFQPRLVRIFQRYYMQEYLQSSTTAQTQGKG